jgi:hypothetical protein
MQAHYTSFTPEAMRAFGQELAAESERRREFIEDARHRTFAMLADFRRDHHEAEAQRRQRAAQEADGRQLFVSELRSGVHALRGRFEADIGHMAAECRATSRAFRSRPSRPKKKLHG